jgi:hypothetical protein
MSFLNKLFRKKPVDWSGKIHQYFQSPQKIQASLEKEIDLWTSIRLSEYSSVPFPPLDRWSTALETVSLPKNGFRMPESWSDLSLGDCLSQETLESLIQVLLLPGPQPKLEMYKKFIGQKEISQIIAKQLQGIILEINKKLNPLSQILKSSGWEDQMYKVIESFVPGIQSSLAEKLAESSLDASLREILQNTIRLGLQVRANDFHFPPKSEWEHTVEAWKEFLHQLGKDEKLKSEFMVRKKFAIFCLQIQPNTKNFAQI